MATKLSLKELAAAAVEFNKVLGPKPPINVKGDEASLTEELTECLELISEEDTFSKGTQKVIDALNVAANNDDDDEDEDDEEEAPAPKKGKAAPAPVKGKKAPVVEEDEDDDEEEEEEEEVPAPKKGKAPMKVVAKGGKKVVDEDDDDDDDEEEEEAPKKGAKKPVAPVKGKKAPVVEEDEDDDEEEEEEEVPVKKGKAAPAPTKKAAPAPVKGKKAPVVEEDDDDDDDAEGNLYDTIKATAKKADLQAIVKENDEFKKKRKSLLEISNVFTLKAEMLKLVPQPEADDDDEEEEAPKKKAAAPVKKAAPAPAPKKKAVVVEEDDDDEEEEEDEEDESPIQKVLDVVKAAKERKVIIAVVKAHPDMFEGFKTKKYEELKALKAAINTLLAKQAAKAPAKKAAPVKKAAAKKESGGAFTKVGIQDAMYAAVQDAGEVGISYEGIMKKMVKKFPDRDPQAMRRTLGVAVPSRMETRFGVKVEQLENGKWRVKVKKGKK